MATEDTVLLDASTVYAEGILWGLREAAQIVGRDDVADIPDRLQRLITEYRARVIHNRWLASRGRPEELPDAFYHPDD